MRTHRTTELVTGTDTIAYRAGRRAGRARRWYRHTDCFEFDLVAAESHRLTLYRHAHRPYRSDRAEWRTLMAFHTGYRDGLVAATAANRYRQQAVGSNRAE